MLPTQTSDVCQNGGAAVLSLRGHVTLEHARELRQTCLELAAQAGPLELDWSEATHLDAASLQVLLSLRAALQEQGRSLAVRGDQPGIRRTLERAGLTQLFPEAPEQA